MNHKHWSLLSRKANPKTCSYILGKSLLQKNDTAGFYGEIRTRSVSCEF